MRLIDADELMKYAHDVTLSNGAKHRCVDATVIYDIPTAEAIELSKIEHDAELLKTDADGFKERIQKDIDNGKEPDQAMVIMMHTAVVSHSALTCLVDRYRRGEE